MIDAEFEIDISMKLLNKIQQSERDNLVKTKELDEMCRHIQSLSDCKHYDNELQHLITDFLACVDALKKE
jgi:hypothetical protein